MSKDLVLKALDLVVPEFSLSRPSSSIKSVGKGKAPEDQTVIKPTKKLKKKSYKSEIEKEAVAKKRNFLLHNLTYMQHMADRQYKPSEMNKMIMAHRRKFTNWRELELKTKLKKKKPASQSVFDESDFQRWAADLVPKKSDPLLS